MKKNIYSVGQVNQYIKNMFVQDFMLRNLCIKGEVSNCKYHSSGHIYFTLKDDRGTMRAVMFSSYRKGLSFHMKEGDRVIVTGSVEVYERDGLYQIYAREIEPDGEGNLYLKFEALKRELEEMGMFADEYKQPIPKYAGRIGVVTAPTGAAVQDIRNISARRNPCVQLILYPALVQGDGAAESIVNGIHALTALSVDVIIVGRGGGSIEDLWAFNEEIVARAIFECPIPIISAVGHQTDWTIADYVADLRAPTPSAAAELAVFDYEQTRQEILSMKRELVKELKRKLTEARNRLNHQSTRLRYLSPRSRLNENRRWTAELEEKLTLRMQGILKEKRHRLMLLSNTLEGYSPMHKLGGGYAYVEKEDGRALRSVGEIQAKDKLKVHLADGTICCEAEEIQASLRSEDR